jgi:hypothetical protein
MGTEIYCLKGLHCFFKKLLNTKTQSSSFISAGYWDARLGFFKEDTVEELYCDLKETTM